MHCSTDRAVVDGLPVPATLTAAQVLTLFPRGVMGLREVAGYPDKDDAVHSDDYVFPLSDGTLCLRPGAHYTMSPPSSRTTAPLATRDRFSSASDVRRHGGGFVAAPGWHDPISTGSPITAPTRRQDVFAFTPPLAEESNHGHACVQYAARQRQLSQDLSQPMPFATGNATLSTGIAYSAMGRSPSGLAEHGVDRGVSVASSVDEIVEDGPSVGHLLTDLHIDSANGPSNRSGEHNGGEGAAEEGGHAVPAFARQYEQAQLPSEEEAASDNGDDRQMADGEVISHERACRRRQWMPRDEEQARDLLEGTPLYPGVQLERPGKLVQDRVHEHILLPMLAIDIVDTPEFQRLRGLKQLGTTVFLYPGATHTRFEHCIGVAHLASQMVRSLATRQPELRITDADILCVTVAGLCHDIGHGPFSHLFEHVINRMSREQASTDYHPNILADGGSDGGSDSGGQQTPLRRARMSYSMPRYDRTMRREDPHLPHSQRSTNGLKTPCTTTEKAGMWHHESMSIQLLRAILSRIELHVYGLNDADARFIELCILGLPPSKPWPEDVGRPPHKRFLVDIVANKRHGIDVDKLDYFLRDSLGVYGKAAADVHFPRLLSACRVLPFDGQFQICYEEKLALNLGDIFTVRAKLHKYAYQHRIVKVIDYMVSDALAAADPYFLITGSDGRRLRISESVHDQEAFCKLGDWILDAISASSEPSLQPARDIINRLTRRDLYPCVGQATFGMASTTLTEDAILDELVGFSLPALRRNERYAASNEEFCAARLREVIIVCFISITYGSSDSSGVPDDPINNVTFYNPKNVNGEAFKLPSNRLSPLFSPSAYQERTIMILVRDSECAAAVAEGWGVWKKRKQPLLTVAVPNSNARGSPVKRPRDARSRQPSATPFKPRRLEAGVQNSSGDAYGERTRPTLAAAVQLRSPPQASAVGQKSMPYQTRAVAATADEYEEVGTETRLTNAAAMGLIAARSAPSVGTARTDLIPNPLTFSQKTVDVGYWSQTLSSQSAGTKPRSQGLSGTDASTPVANSQQYSRGVPPMLYTGRPSADARAARQRH